MKPMNELCEEWDIGWEEIIEESNYEENETKRDLQSQKGSESDAKINKSEEETKDINITRESRKLNKEGEIGEQDVICVLKNDYIDKEGNILVDSGATSHISNDESMFIKFNDDFVP